MKPKLYGVLPKPAVAVVGVWDPFSTSHRELFLRLRAYSVENSCSSLGVLIDPPPGAFSSFKARYRVSGWPEYDSVRARVRFILNCGVDAVLCMRFCEQDFSATAEDFLDAVRAHARLEELWLGALQLLGPGPRGSMAAVAEYTNLHGMHLRILPPPPLLTYDVRAFLASGRLIDAIQTVGHPPVWDRPSSGELHLAWRPGLYRAFPMERPEAKQRLDEIKLTLAPSQSGPAKLLWPSRSIRYLAFSSGPADPQSAQPGDTA
jgi:FAD synthase